MEQNVLYKIFLFYFEIKSTVTSKICKSSEICFTYTTESLFKSDKVSKACIQTIMFIYKSTILSHNFKGFITTVNYISSQKLTHLFQTVFSSCLGLYKIFSIIISLYANFDNSAIRLDEPSNNRKDYTCGAGMF